MKIIINTCMFFIMLLLVSCCSSNISKNVISIGITKYPQNNNQKEILLEDKSKIKKIEKLLNCSKRELRKFIPKYKLRLIYDKGEKIILVKDDMINIEGITYRSKNNIEMILSNMGF